jgi:endonuclease-3
MTVNIEKILEILEYEYGHEKCGLHFNSEFELLVATMLSAQCTDVRVNIVTESLFQQYNKPEDFAGITADELKPMIKSCGLSNTKSKNIVAASHIILQEYDGKVPDEFKELIKLPGVGRKTANVVLSNAFNEDAIAVDTHVFRVSNRIGLAKSDNVLYTEKQLMEAIPKKKWSQAHHWIIWHGRKVCSARKPDCEKCPLSAYCEQNL